MVRVSEGYLAVVVGKLGLEVFLKVGFELFQEFSGHGKMIAQVVINALAS